MAAKQYAPHNNTMIVGGVPILGFSKGTFIKIEKREDSVDVIAGIGGFATFVHMLDPVHTVEFVLEYGSDSNDYLSALAAANDRVPGSGVVGTVIKNQMGRGFFTAAESALMKQPNTEETDTQGNPKTWTLVCVVEPGAYFAGGL